MNSTFEEIQEQINEHVEQTGEEDDWPVENIPDKAKLFYRIHKQNYKDGKVVPGTFKEIGTTEEEKGMSTDWEKYSTPEQSRLRAKKPEQNGIVSFVTGHLRKIVLDVIHYPLPLEKNRAHTNVRGIDSEKQLKMRDIYAWEIEIPNQIK